MSEESRGVGGTFEEAALEIISAVVAGELEPAEGAYRLWGCWVPAETVSGPGAKSLGPPTRGDSLGAFCATAMDLANGGNLAEARRLAELAWILSKRVEDLDTMVTCAATLAQTMTGDPAATRERLELLEFAVPNVMAWDRPGTIKAAMLAQLAEARYNEAAGNEHRLRETIAACEDALEWKAELDHVWLHRIHFYAGTAHDALAPSEPDLCASVDHLGEALRCATSEDERASTLNNLGNAWLDLGILTADDSAVEAAVGCYDQALPLRHDERGRTRTQVNRARAERALDSFRQKHTSGFEPGHAADREVDKLLSIGDSALRDALGSEQRQDAFRRRAATHYARAAALLGRSGAPHLRAEVFHRLAGMFVSSPDNDDCQWTAFCFANAARRLAAADWRAGSLARLDSQTAEMLIAIGYPDDTPYLRRALTLLDNALPILTAIGQPGEAERANRLHDATKRGLLSIWG